MLTSFVEYCNGSRIEKAIPKNFHFIEGSIDKGLVIADTKGNQYVRIPSGFTSDGIYEKGFWISRYEISLDENGNPRTIANQYPAVQINYFKAIELAKSNGMQYDLPSKEQYNRICMWFVESNAASFEQVFRCGNGMGNYSKPFKLVKTSSKKAWMKNNLDNFWGNCFIWTTEESELYEMYKVIRGGAGSYFDNGDNYSCTVRAWADPRKGANNISFRIVMNDEFECDDD